MTLIEFFKKKNDAWNELQCYGMVNTYGKTDAERVELDFGYEKAKIKYLKASQEYQQALNEMAEIQEDAK